MIAGRCKYSDISAPIGNSVGLYEVHHLDSGLRAHRMRCSERSTEYEKSTDMVVLNICEYVSN